ncbi:MAG: aminopeptidase N [Gammaproteobacteria bacterium]|nr:aminopeptidase N [Gammaproteobacteria bacterium]MCF6261575.1 aminopeptidase N [Gammaproteobacteria bacterium]
MTTTLTQGNTSQPKTVRLADYRAPDFFIDSVALDFDLGEADTQVSSVMQLRRNAPGGDSALLLNGRDLELISVSVDGHMLDAGDYELDTEVLCIPALPDVFTLEIVTRIHPQDNTSLGGLYTSGGNFCTQCEAEEFRKITYYLDRPDVMAKFTTTITADKTQYPVLLSNGNLLETGELDGGRHWAKWQDPFPKPSYLFALVAGDLACIKDTFVTLSGRTVDLHLYVQHHNVDKCEHAMRSLKNAMSWDEKVYGREYDLDLYMIVAVDDFNMGAMENKGLNVFNSRYVLARPDTATDADYQGIEGVIGHEYFHNWSGNRVTCRDWFQLSLKEGFTVYRDEEFSADMGSRGVKRIEDVNVLRTHQFREDAGPMAHPVRPESYVEINNFYTVTVYNKGAEVVRMLAHLVGEKGFRRGTDLYFERHDGQAVTTDDFVAAIEDANETELSLFKNWYRQAGTPVLDVQQEYDADKQRYRLTVRQSCPPTPDQPEKQPFHIPLAVGLLDEAGNDFPLRLRGENTPMDNNGTRVLDVREVEQVFEFEDIPYAPTPSLLRGFSAPVKLQSDVSDEQFYFLMGHDSDPFNRWEAGQQMAVKIIVALTEKYQRGEPLSLSDDFVAAMEKTLLDTELDKALVAAALSLPSEVYLGEFMAVIDPVALHEVRCFVRRSLAQRLQSALLSRYKENQNDGEYRVDAEAIGQRALKNICLSYLMALNDADVRVQCVAQFEAAHNMTDVMVALSCLVNSEGDEREKALSAFYTKWQGDPLVVDKWLTLQATSRLPGALKNVQALIEHKAFSIKNPNKVRALIGAFCTGNPAQFHAIEGTGYVFLADHIIALDKLNPQVAARISNVLSQWRRYDQKRQKLMKVQMQRVLAEPGLSRDVYEVMSKSLAD